MNTYDFLNESVIALALICTIVGLVIIVIVAGADSLAATGLKDLAILLGGGLLGSKVPKTPN